MYASIVPVVMDVMKAAAVPAQAQDPVVRPELVERFEQDGYLVLENVLAPEKVSSLLEVIGRLKAKLEASSHRRDVFGLDIRPVVTEHDAFLELMEWPATFPLAVRFLQHYSIQLQTSHLIMVPPGGGERNIGWHDDGGVPRPKVNGVRPLVSLKIGYFLTDLLEPDMGQLMVVPGSHLMPGGPKFSNGKANPGGAIQLMVRAGSAVFFQQRLWHAGALNYSNATRVVLYYGYSYRWQKPIDYESMPAALLEKCTPIGRQLLGAKSSHLGYYVPSDEDCPLKAWYRERFGETWIE